MCGDFLGLMSDVEGEGLIWLLGLSLVVLFPGLYSPCFFGLTCSGGCSLFWGFLSLSCFLFSFFSVNYLVNVLVGRIRIAFCWVVFYLGELP